MNTFIKKPSPKIISLGIIAIAIVFVTVLLKQPAKIDVPATKDDIQVTEKTVKNSVTEIDSDGDGLKDWEESLWKTDPMLPDTDGDGVSDNEMVLNYRQEQEQNRQSTLEEVQKILAEQAKLLASGEITATEAASRGLIAQYFLFKETNTPITSESVELFTKSLSQTTIEPTVYTTYTASDTTASLTSGVGAVKAYGNAVGTILSNVIEPNVPHELLIFVQFEQTNDIKTFQAHMKTVDARYEYTIKNLLTTPVPKEMLSAHVNLLNALSKTRTDLQKMTAFSNNALQSMLSFKSYETNSARVTEAFAQMRTIFNTMRVIFNETDPGRVLTAQS